MTNSSVASDLGKSLNIQRDISSEITFYFNTKSVDCVSKLSDFIIRQILAACVSIDPGFCENLVCSSSADSVDICEADINSLFSW